MKWLRFPLVAAVLVLAINAAPLVQLVKTGGLLYYRNGDGEPAYLQYDFSLRTQSLSRIGQWPVSLLHESGLSGGWINFIFDATLPLAFLFLTRSLGRALGLDERPSLLLATMLTIGPQLASGANPLAREFFSRAAASGAIRWVALTDASFLPIARTPEPQVSLVLLAAAALLGLRRHSLWPLFVALPFLYTFIALPTAFVVLALQTLGLLRSSGRVASRNRAVGSACVIAWIALSAAAAVMLALSVPATLRQFLLTSHAPMFSVHAGLALGTWAAIRRAIRTDLREFALIVALAPMAAENIQVIMGWLVAPIAIELYGGSICLALVIGLAMAAPAQPGQAGPARPALAGAAALLFAVTCSRAALLAWQTPVLDGPVLDALRLHSSRVAASDGRLARLLSMVLSRQERTALDFAQTDPKVDPDNSFPRYLSDRAAILADPRRRGAFTALLGALDSGYTHRNEDALYSTSGRPKEYVTSVDVPTEAARWPGRSHDLIFVAVRNGRVVLDP